MANFIEQFREFFSHQFYSKELIINFLSFVISGVSIPLVINLINLNGGNEKSTFLIALPHSLGMCTLILWRLDAFQIGIIRWDSIFLIAIVEAISQALVLDGLLFAGSAIFTVAFSSVTIYTAILSYIVLGRILNYKQIFGMIVVVIGLAFGAIDAGSLGNDVLIGSIFILLGAFFHSVNYIISECTLTTFDNPIRPELLAFLLGTIGIFINICWQIFHTLPQIQLLVIEPILKHNGNVHVIILSYLALIAAAAVHSLNFYFLIKHIGSTSTGLLKSVQSVLVFIGSHFAFCRYQPSQCFTKSKSISLFIVVSGVLIYTYFTDHRKRHYDIIEDISAKSYGSIDNVKEELIELEILRT